ncbi:hypothetical protein RHS04_09609 [Rhizoctonia solani]|uniref:Secreted protein n=1 Tax=Rhizoctonia solani TaxID=456999 RepID=A0A8H7GXT8_9AGAM|nr:hypothetical protein RHS04_09609 [Rhizoctonia solani]
MGYFSRLKLAVPPLSSAFVLVRWLAAATQSNYSSTHRYVPAEAACCREHARPKSANNVSAVGHVRPILAWTSEHSGQQTGSRAYLSEAPHDRRSSVFCVENREEHTIAVCGYLLSPDEVIEEFL